MKTLFNNGLISCSDFWGYFEPIRQSMPQNCSADVQAVITHLDAILSGNNQQEIYEVLDKFGLQSMVAHPDDAAAACKLFIIVLPYFTSELATVGNSELQYQYVAVAATRHWSRGRIFPILRCS